jgi:FAD:protein FMN transferase
LAISRRNSTPRHPRHHGTWALLALVACRGAGDAVPADASSHATVAEPIAAAVEPAAPAPAANADVAAPPVRKDGTIFAASELMGTSVSINVWLDPGREAGEAGAAIQAAFDEIARIEAMMSEWKPTSELTRFNEAAGGAAMKLSPELFTVLQRSREVSEATDGAFDVTFHAVGSLWKFDVGSRPPERAAIEAKRGLIDWRRIELDADTHGGRLATVGMKVGLGAIAKGYAVDRASELLRARGFRNHVVEGGGDTYVSGTKAGKPWMVGVQDPDGKGVVGALPSSDTSVVTSGDYQRYFEFEGKRYAHIFDPRTGYPLESSKSAKSVTLVAANATDADAYATAVTVMGPTAGMAFVEAHPGMLDAVIITRDDEVLVSSGLRERFVWAPDRAPPGAKAAQPTAPPTAAPAP